MACESICIEECFTTLFLILLNQVGVFLPPNRDGWQAVVRYLGGSTPPIPTSNFNNNKMTEIW